MRVQTEHEIDSPDKALPVGAVYAWDVTQDLVPGRFGIELARRMTLVEPGQACRQGGSNRWPPCGSPRVCRRTLMRSPVPARRSCGSLPQPSLMPELTIEGGLAIGVATATLWGLAFAFRLRKLTVREDICLEFPFQGGNPADRYQPWPSWLLPSASGGGGDSGVTAIVPQLRLLPSAVRPADGRPRLQGVRCSARDRHPPMGGRAWKVTSY